MTNSTNEEELELGVLDAYQKLSTIKEHIREKVSTWDPDGDYFSSGDLRTCSQKILNLLRRPKFRNERRFVLLGLGALDETDLAHLATAVANQRASMARGRVDFRRYAEGISEVVSAYANNTYNDERAKNNEEVFTPSWLVEEMLDDLPDEVWSNPDLKWLDPCAGVGTFAVRIICRLMDGLKKFERNEAKRYRHIVENMLYQCDIEAATLFLNLFVLEPKDGNVRVNIHLGSFSDKGTELTQTFKDQMAAWGVEKFDIIVGNPPYTLGRNPIYAGFMNRALDIVSDDGFVNMVAKTTWFTNPGMPQHEKDLRDTVKEGELLKALTVYDSSKKVFGVLAKEKENDGISGGVMRAMLSKSDAWVPRQPLLQVFGEKQDPQTDMPQVSDRICWWRDLLVPVTDDAAMSLLAKVTTKVDELGCVPASGEKFFAADEKRDGKNHNPLGTSTKADEGGELTCVIRGGSEVPVNRSRVTKNADCIEKWKVFVTKTGLPESGLRVGGPGDVCSATFRLVGTPGNEQETLRLADYLTCDFANFVLTASARSHDAPKRIYDNLPNLPMDREWTEDAIQDFFDLTDAEVACFAGFTK